MTITSASPPQDGEVEVPHVVRLPAQVEGRCLPGLRQQLFSGLLHHDVVVVHCDHVEKMSAAGQAMLVAAHRLARHRHARLRFERPTTAMIAALRSNGLGHLLTDQL